MTLSEGHSFISYYQVFRCQMGADVWVYVRFPSLLTLDYLLFMEFIQFPSRVTIRYNLFSDKLLGVKIPFLSDKGEFYFTLFITLGR